tara:strand:- start:216 stop:431 length:216 start_codon:yes stop_codon:yes gene_type:complete
MSTPAETLQVEKDKLKAQMEKYNTSVTEFEKQRLEMVAELQQQQGRVNLAQEQADAAEAEACPAPDSLSQA